LCKESLELSRRKMKLLVQVDLAKALGDTEELTRLMAEAKAMDYMILTISKTGRII
jgi:hypothetical protein